MQKSTGKGRFCSKTTNRLRESWGFYELGIGQVRRRRSLGLAACRVLEGEGRRAI